MEIGAVGAQTLMAAEVENARIRSLLLRKFFRSSSTTRFASIHDVLPFVIAPNASDEAITK